jgi:GT2 family glycosyltransferase
VTSASGFFVAEAESMMMPKVSIILPVFNGERYIRESLESALSQDYDDLEVIVVDDGSTDSTPSILREYKGRIRCIRQPNQGAAAAFNAGIRLAQGSLIAWLSADDVHFPEKTRRQVALMVREPDVALVYADCVVIDSDGNFLHNSRSHCFPQRRLVRELLSEGFFITSPTMMVRRDALEAIGLLDESLLAYVDADMQLRLARAHRFAHIDEILGAYRMHPGNQSQDRLLLQRCRDRIFRKVLRTFSPEEIFAASPTGSRLATHYEELSWDFARQLCFAAAANAAREALRSGRSVRRAILWFLFMVARARPVIWCLLWMLALRRRRLASGRKGRRGSESPDNGQPCTRV